jgi:structural maintenance of chromosome 3 (chondroitin sulfate proteoglycan 6)
MFALQKCDPSPIYLLDEIDSALDLEHRKMVANWLRRGRSEASEGDAKSPQFIVTTFRRELVDRADKVIGVSIANNASRITNMNKEDAIQFITRYEDN